MSSVSIEEVKALYFDADSIQMPPYKLFQMHYGGKRYYYEMSESPGRIAPIFYNGVTSLLSTVVPEGEGLKMWRENMGSAEAERYMNLRAAYGSCMHTQFTHLLMDGQYDLDRVPQIVSMYQEANGVLPDVSWVDEMRKDMLAFAQWIYDTEVQPIVIEAPLRSKLFNLAGTMDLFAIINYEEKGFFGEEYKTGEKKGQPKESKRIRRVLAIIDYKSSKSGSFFLNHELQLAFYEVFIRENFPEYADVEIRLFNWSPKDWRTNPDYHFTEQTGKHSLEILTAYAMIYDHVGRNIAEAGINEISGIIDITEKSSIEDNIKRKKLHELITERKNRSTEDVQAPISGVHQDRGEDEERTGEGISDKPGLF